MLIQFNFKNYKAFNEETSLNMISSSIKEHMNNVIVPSQKFADSLLKVVAIYGANASGKSSVIEAFQFMKEAVSKSFMLSSVNKSLHLKQFAFQDEKTNSLFEVFIRTRSGEYQYGFEMNAKSEIMTEWLFKRDMRYKEKYVPVIERNGTEISHSKIKELKVIQDKIKDSSLVLSVLAGLTIKEIQDVYDWFSETPIIDFGNPSYESIHSTYIDEKIEDPLFQLEIVKFLNAISVPISKINVEKNMRDNQEYYRISSVYDTPKGPVEIPFKDESSGTQKVFSMFFELQDVFLNGGIICIDELDAKLHPLLLRYIIDLFHDPDTNPKNAQLIYTTHDNYTLTNDVFRRDQIWFVEKKNDLSSELYSLVEYKLDEDRSVRNDASYHKDYLLGKYGGVPILKGFNMWGTSHD